jgi:hypothetical protein
LLPRGFLSSADRLYDFGRHGYGAYLSDLARQRTWRINALRLPHAAYEALLDNKLLFAAAVPPPLRAPEVLAWVHGSRWVATGERWRGRERASVAELCAAAGGAFVLKPIDGAGGRDVHVVAAHGGELLIDGAPVVEERAERLLRAAKDAIACEHIVQGAFAAELFPDSVNTLRILTMLDPRDGEPFVAIAVQRIGTRRSAPTDNWRRGGLSAGIDLATGELGPAAAKPAGGARCGWLERHPESGAAIAGRRVPGWEGIRADVVAAARALPFLPYVGWDLALTEAGPVAIEGNSSTDVDLLQIHRPLLLDPRVRAFFADHGIVR